MGDRRRIAFMSLAYDGVMAVVAGALAIDLRNGLHLSILHGATRFHIDWSSFLVVGLLLTVFWLHGLYKAEAYVSWRVHLRLVVRALLVTLVVAAAAMYVLHASSSFGSRLVATLGRVFVLGRLARRMLDPDARTLLVGMAPGLERLSRRLRGLRTYDYVELLQVNGYDAEQLKGHVVRRVRESQVEGAARIRNVFIDALSMSPEDVVLLSQAAKELGCDVYVASMLVHALASGRLLEDLF
jgi:FlaA1/EpsC-like NDP-sugar epimerase